MHAAQPFYTLNEVGGLPDPLRRLPNSVNSPPPPTTKNSTVYKELQDTDKYAEAGCMHERCGRQRLRNESNQTPCTDEYSHESHVPLTGLPVEALIPHSSQAEVANN